MVTSPSPTQLGGNPVGVSPELFQDATYAAPIFKFAPGIAASSSWV